MSRKDPLEWEEVNVDHLIKNEWIDFRVSRFRFPDGTEFEPYYSYSRRDYVVIVPVDTDGNLICVRQYRYGLREVTTEFPAGGIERTDGKEYGGDKDINAEDALDAARRELREETGYASDEWTHLLTVPSNATVSDNYAHLYLARNCRKVSEQDLDDTEYCSVVKHTADEIEAMIKDGSFQQSVHVAAWLLALRENL